MLRESTFLVERYMPQALGGHFEALATRLLAAGEELRAEGRDVRWLRSLAVPDDETCLCVFAARRLADVEELNRRAAASYVRIVSAVELGQL